MENKITEDYKPRTWLLIILIIMALVIIVILVNKIILDRNAKRKERHNMFDMFNTITEKGKEKIESFDIENFNFSLKSLSGTTVRASMAYKIDKIIDSNRDNPEHLVTLCYKDTCTVDGDEIREIKKEFTKNISTKDPDWFEKETRKYDVILEYDNDGYINKVTIEE